MKSSIDEPMDRRKDEPVSHWRELLRPVEVLVWLLIAVVVVELYTRAGFLITHLFSVLLLFVFAAIIALLLTPVVDRIETVWIFRKRRGLAVIALLLVVIAVIAGLILLIAPSLTAQARQIPSLIGKAQGTLIDLQNQLNSHGIPFRFDLKTGPSNGAVIGSALGILSGTLTTVIDILLVTVITVYRAGAGARVDRRSAQALSRAPRGLRLRHAGGGHHHGRLRPRPVDHVGPDGPLHGDRHEYRGRPLRHRPWDPDLFP